MMTLALFMLCLGLFQFSFASSRFRSFTLVQEDGDWTTAVEKCKERNESIATLYDEDDVNVTFKLVEVSAWVGLRRRRDNVITWSDGTPYTFDVSNVTVENGMQICEAMENGTRKGFSCSERKAFMCYKETKYELIKNEPKDWCQALQYCRRHFTDLVRISDGEQKSEVIQSGESKTFWIGLMHDQWEWEDGSCSTYRDWEKPENHQSCSFVSFQDESLRPFSCGGEVEVICSNGYVRIKVIKEPKTWEDALDYCNANHTSLLRIEGEDDTLAVAQWLNYTDVSGPFWIGMRQSIVFGFWIWSDRIVSYSNWKNNQSELPSSNRCGAISKTDNYKWSAEPCWERLPFLCEEDIVFMNKSSNV